MVQNYLKAKEGQSEFKKIEKKKVKTCNNCRKKGHYAWECRNKKKSQFENSNNANMVEKEIKEFIAMVSKGHIGTCD